MRTEEQTDGTDIMKEVGAIRDFAKAPKMYCQFAFYQ